MTAADVFRGIASALLLTVAFVGAVLVFVVDSEPEQ